MFQSNKKILKNIFKKAVDETLIGKVPNNSLNQRYFKERQDFAVTRFKKQVKLLADWLVSSNERSNFTYELRPVNYAHLAGFLSQICRITVEQAYGYIDELIKDEDIKQVYRHVSQKYDANTEPLWGRRIGWYVIVRVLKPELVVETGVHYGLGALAITSALLRNKEEGFNGKYIGLEILPQFGGFLVSPYLDVGEIIYGDSLDSLKSINKKIDVFIHDSNHEYENEMAELELAESKLSDKGLLISDNSYTSMALYDHARKTNKNYLHFQEITRYHFYTGAGFGVAWHRID